MTRRLTTVIVAVAVIAVLLAGVTTATLARIGARGESLRQAENAAGALVEPGAGEKVAAARARGGLPFPCNVLQVPRLARLARLSSVSCIVVADDGSVRPVEIAAATRAQVLPAVLTEPFGITPLDVVGLDADRTIGVVRAGSAIAVRRIPPDAMGAAEPRIAVVVIRPVSSPLSGSVLRWLVVGSVVAALLGALLARLLSVRLARPLAAATDATVRLAAGDLSVRLPIPSSATDTAGDGDELVALSHAINSLAASLERSRGLEQRFLLSVSHDLRTPLTSIRGYAEALADGTVDDVRAGTAVILRESARLERLVHDLLDLARLDARSFRFELRPLDLGEVAREAADGLRPDATAAGVELVAVVAPRPVVVTADRDRLGQLIANLVENAVKFARSRIEVRVGIDAQGAWLVVADDGPGIAPADRPHVFERLYVSTHAPVRKEAGSGLGLAIVAELATAMGGTVYAGADEPGGTAMVLRLPVVG